MRERFDAIVVGAGLGGLVAAAVMSREGLRVLVLEQGREPGGYGTTFRRRGYTFEASVHAVDGMYDPANPNLALFEELGLLSKIEWVHIPEFYALRHRGREIVVPEGVEATVEALGALFPQERENIARFLRKLARLRAEILRFPSATKPPLATRLTLPFDYPAILGSLFSRLGPVVERSFRDEALKLALTVNTGYYHDDPFRYSMLHYGGAQGSYITGGSAYPRGGSRAVVAHLAGLVEAGGGEVRCGHEVGGIEVAGGRVRGARGEAKGAPFEVDAPTVIVNAPLPEVERFLPEEIAKRLFRRTRKMRASHSAFALYLALKRPLAEAGVRRYSTFLAHDELARFKDSGAFNRTDDFSRKTLALVDYGAIDSGLGDDPSRTTAAVVALDWIDAWESLERPAYEARKEEVSARILDRLDAEFPGFRSCVDFHFAATPVTMRRYTRNPGGCIYGFAQSWSQVGPRRPAVYSGLPGLYFASAWSRPGGGVSATIKCGFTAAREALAAM